MACAHGGMHEGALMEHDASRARESVGEKRCAAEQQAQEISLSSEALAARKQAAGQLSRPEAPGPVVAVNSHVGAALGSGALESCFSDSQV